MNILILCLFALVSFPVTAADQQQLLKESRAAGKSFASQLKSELQQGMQNGGPEGAVQVCHTVAADIAQQVSQQYGWEIGRTSLKVRNPNNAPDNWEKQVLNDFEIRRTHGDDINTMEFYELVTANGKPVFRYMKAIPTGTLCLSCHGENIPSNVSDILNKLYPEDKARGFKVGDIRGAFSITRPIQ